MDTFVIFFVYIAVLILSVVVHEVSHGAVANALGDPTAKLAGRLTLNPVPHIDIFGSIILPLLLMIPAIFGVPTVIFGWAKPVPYNPYNLRNQRWGSAIVGLAGPFANFTIAALFGIGMRFLPLSGVGDVLFPVLLVFGVIVYLNLLLGLFNLLPISPLDGSKVLFSFPVSAGLQNFLTRYGFFVLMLFIFFGFQFVSPILTRLFLFITGYPAAMLF